MGGGPRCRIAVMLAPVAYLASVSSTAELVESLLPECLRESVDINQPHALNMWQSATGGLY